MLGTAAKETRQYDRFVRWQGRINTYHKSIDCMISSCSHFERDTSIRRAPYREEFMEMPIQLLLGLGPPLEAFRQSGGGCIGLESACTVDQDTRRWTSKFGVPSQISAYRLRNIGIVYGIPCGKLRYPNANRLRTESRWYGFGRHADKTRVTGSNSPSREISP